ncbi:ESCRT-0 subunit protein HSE1 KNAG_0A06710 [Huiozyma naganishii CBS 8797]|uniref:Class E vacuolar protein-sorting machinery protein HSE1 n=1 Tax=Huiozyma naganishii (strain ATCC MYA-139 / BCRC 22969 / CBS 8797 / KCTC 17520 / NBRC 10181 / NCYC 3082 / Yp74L-3) TaxID=1071383 RepID=J7RU40_HUIN7|nr:hypothetical protein KNAG_0A06710 [Kazachstania naganishii CBS 8797]CCK68327.1 hypothetical protein KNAG_0A06710 [Kazachstania naganishii CBS 8797]
MSSKLLLSKAVLRATDAKLRADNWQYIIEVCDVVRDDPEDNGKEVMKLIERRLEQKDANVVLRSLALIVALAENCGSRLKQEISSKHFVNILYSMVDDESAHIDLRRSVAKTVQQLSDSFKDDPSLKGMNDLYLKTKRHHGFLLTQPDKPHKHQVSSESKTQEDRDLQEALKLSLTEFESKRQDTDAGTSKGSYTNLEQRANQPEVTKRETGTNTIKKVRAMYDLETSDPKELAFRKDDIIVVIEQSYKDWWLGSLGRRVGIFPLNYVTPIIELTPEQKQKELDLENHVFGQKGKIDHLHSTFKNSTAGQDLIQNEELNQLYGSVTPLRPQITKMIGKYAKEKEDVNSLRQVLANAESTYNQLLDRAANAYRAVPVQQQQSFAPPPQNHLPPTYGDHHAYPQGNQPNYPSFERNYGQPN